MDTSNPAFICPACGYFCEGSWTEIDLEDGVPGVISRKFSVRETAMQSPLGARHDYI
jgi:hypothetical protein